MRVKRAMVTLLAALSVGASVGCAPDFVGPATVGGITCGAASATAAMTPGIKYAAAPIDLTLTGPSTTAACHDGSGGSITSAQVDSVSIAFPALGCLAIDGAVGTGTAVIRWSDGTTSNADATATLGGVLMGTLDLHVTSGHYAGTSGSAPFTASLSAGDCANGVTAEWIGIAGIVLS